MEYQKMVKQAALALVQLLVLPQEALPHEEQPQAQEAVEVEALALPQAEVVVEVVRVVEAEVAALLVEA